MMKFVVIWLCICGLGVSTALAQPRNVERTLFDFAAPGAEREWQTVNDGVMGGRSSGRFKITNEGTLEFSGTLSLENNGGFASVRSRLKPIGLNAGDTLVIRARGDGREYTFNLYVPSRTVAFSYRTTFRTEKDQWVEVELPLDRFEATSFGRVVSGQPLVPGNVQGVGVLLGDKRPGAFRLELGSIRVRSQAPEDEAQEVAPTTDGSWSAISQFFEPPPDLQADLGNYRSPLLFADGREVRTPDDWQLRRDEILQSWHTLMGAWPESNPQPAVQYLETTRREDLTQHKVRIEVAPEVSTGDAYLLVPDGDGPFPAVLVVYYDAATGAGLDKELRDFGYQLAKRGFVTLSIGTPSRTQYPSDQDVRLQPLSFLAFAATQCGNAVASLPQVDPRRIGIVGHSYGGKWAMFASCLSDRFACAAWSDGGVVFDERRGNVNYWEPWYLGFDPQRQRKPGIPSEENPRTGAYRQMVEAGHDLHELHALMAPRPFLVSGGSEDPPERWRALNHSIAVNRLLGYENRVGMTNRSGHTPTAESNEQVYQFFDHFLKRRADESK